MPPLHNPNLPYSSSRRSHCALFSGGRFEATALCGANWLRMVGNHLAAFGTRRIFLPAARPHELRQEAHHKPLRASPNPNNSQGLSLCHTQIMAPRLFDGVQIANALRNEALPALERLAQNTSLRDCAVERFDRDEPPPYVSSTEDKAEDEFYLTHGPIDDALLEELKILADQPLDDAERDRAATFLQHDHPPAYSAGWRYYEEVKIERERVKDWASFKARPDVRDYFVQYGLARKGRAGEERVNVIARRNIKRRWQKLGVWNPEWGIPDRKNNTRPSDDQSKWKWRWQHGEAAAKWRDGSNPMARNPQHPHTRAIRLRQGLRLGERNPVPPRSHLQNDAAASQAESFIISRPWFASRVEAVEIFERRGRIAKKYRLAVRRRYESSLFFNVQKYWKDNGEWKAEWRKPSGDVLIGWKWRHESPSPEPEDLSGLDDLATFELTPSEADALEAIPPPSPPTPRPAYVPPPPGTATEYSLFGRPPAAAAVAGAAAVAAEQPTEDLANGAEEVAERRQLPRRRQPRNVQPAAQPLRRSPRIAAVAAKRHRREQQQQQQGKSTTRPRRARLPAAPPAAAKSKRGRPRKANSASAGVSKPPVRPRGRPRKSASSGQRLEATRSR